MEFDDIVIGIANKEKDCAVWQFHRFCNWNFLLVQPAFHTLPVRDFQGDMRKPGMLFRGAILPANRRGL